MRSRNGISYLTARRFSAQNRLGSIQAIKRLKASATDRETGLVAAEIAAVWLLLTGNPGGWTVTGLVTGIGMTRCAVLPSAPTAAPRV